MSAVAKPSSGSAAAQRRRAPPAKAKAAPAKPDPQGRREFLRQRCNDCHSVRSQRVRISRRRPGRVVDLSTTGRKRKARWLTSYLRRMARVRGKAHPTRFTGSHTQLDRVVRWLAALR